MRGLRLCVAAAIILAAGACGGQTGVVTPPFNLSGKLDQFAAPSGYQIPEGIVAGPKDHMWFPLWAGAASAIGEIGNDGTITVHHLPEPTAQI